jgi:hypothetical protein
VVCGAAHDRACAAHGPDHAGADPIAAVRDADPIAPVRDADPIAAVRDADPIAAVRVADPIAAVRDADPIVPVRLRMITPMPGVDPRSRRKDDCQTVVV